MLNRRQFLHLTSVAAGATLMAACAQPAPLAPASSAALGASSASGGAVRGGTMNLGTDRGGDADTIGTGRHYARSLYNSLVRSDDKGNISPELAESWQIVDPKTYVFKLRQGVKFHDGTDFTADAVKFNFERIANPATKSLFVSDFVGLDGVDVVDPYTVKLRLKQPDVTMLGRLSGKGSYFASPTAVNQWGADYGQHPVGTGPFQFVQLIPDNSLTLKRWEQYWESDEQGAQLPYLDGLVFKTLTDATARFNALRGGELEYMDELLPHDADVLRNVPELTYTEGPGTAKWLWLNGGKPPFDNKALRQAVAYAIDRTGIHQAVFNNTGVEGRYMYSPLNWAFDSEAPYYVLDPGKVKEKLAEGGQPNGFQFTTHVANTTLDLQLGQAVKGQLAVQNIDMNIEVVETQFIANDRRTSGDFQGSLSQFSPYPDPNDTLYPYLRSGLSTNYVKYANPRVDDLLDQAKGELNQDTRKTMYAEVQRLVVDDTPIVFLHHDAKLTGLSKSVQGYRPTVDTYIGFTERLWLKK
jgi:peptide/nickel transport system substrate-binding protein